MDDNLELLEFIDKYNIQWLVAPLTEELYHISWVDTCRKIFEFAKPRGFDFLCNKLLAKYTRLLSRDCTVFSDSFDDAVIEYLIKRS